MAASLLSQNAMNESESVTIGPTFQMRAIDFDFHDGEIAESYVVSKIPVINPTMKRSLLISHPGVSIDIDESSTLKQCHNKSESFSEGTISDAHGEKINLPP